MASKLLTNVFVYGTLKRDQPNHHWISASMSDSAADANANGTAAFVGCGRTLRKYPLVIGTRYNIPFLLARPDTGHLVHGEVYAIDEAKLAHLDVLEDYPKFYGRAQQDIELLDDRFDGGSVPEEVFVFMFNSSLWYRSGTLTSHSGG